MLYKHLYKHLCYVIYTIFQFPVNLIFKLDFEAIEA